MSQAQLQPHDPSHTSYVLFSRFKEAADDDELILFIAEYDDVADVEQRKAELNRFMPRAVGVDVAVGISRFHPHPDNEAEDFVIITPKDGSSTFTWADMVDIKEIVQLADLRGM